MTPAEFRTIRTRAGLKQYQLATLLGMTAEHISRIENNSKGITTLMSAFMRLLDNEPDLARRVLVQKQETQS